ncbi:hypothetical protein AALO_G00215800 [Alosa alosa]|uniref:Uncharacterized protein n=1 Tax=Alosa alosa TaxID=278164 RepID=A0AAV6G0U5_9TELE|nr:hypothetical protein AALO_G00215800 [Alosa alosa]
MTHGRHALCTHSATPVQHADNGTLLFYVHLYRHVSRPHTHTHARKHTHTRTHIHTHRHALAISHPSLKELLYFPHSLMNASDDGA